VELSGEMCRLGTAPWKAVAADEDDRHRRSTTVLAFREERCEVREILCHDDSVFRHGAIEHLDVIGGTEFDSQGGDGIMPKSGQLIHSCRRHHRIQ
jgi:hypothetical protein